MINVSFIKLPYYSLCWRRQWQPHSSALAWKIPWMEEPGSLQVHGVAGSRTWLSDFAFTFHFHPLEKEMASQSSILAWRIPKTGEPVGFPSMGSHRVGHDWRDLAAAALLLICKLSFPNKLVLLVVIVTVKIYRLTCIES